MVVFHKWRATESAVLLGLRLGASPLYAQAMKLSAGDRAMLARLLLESLESGAEDGVDEDWREEIERRMHDWTRARSRPWPGSR